LGGTFGKMTLVIQNYCVLT